MRKSFLLAVVIGVLLPVCAVTAQREQPPGIDPQTLNRLPPVQRGDLDEIGKTLYDQMTTDAGRVTSGFQGPGWINLHSPVIANLDRQRNQYYRTTSPVGRRLYELAVLVTAREVDQQYVWTVHEAAALNAGLDPAIVEVVKSRVSPDQLPAKERLIIELGRKLLNRQSVDLETFRQARLEFGDRALVDVVSIIGQYAATAVLLNAFDQQVPH